jgi:hypothetical protein
MVGITHGSSAYYVRSDTAPGRNFVFRGNAYLENEYGFWCEGHPLEKVYPGAVWENVTIGSDRGVGLVGKGKSTVISVAEFMTRYKRA